MWVLFWAGPASSQEHRILFEVVIRHGRLTCKINTLGFKAGRLHREHTLINLQKLLETLSEGKKPPTLCGGETGGIINTPGERKREAEEPSSNTLYEYLNQFLFDVD